MKLKEDDVPIDFKPDLFSLIDKDQEREDKLYHGMFIFNGTIYDENIEPIGVIKINE